MIELVHPKTFRVILVDPRHRQRIELLKAQGYTDEPIEEEEEEEEEEDE